jgi:signal transduction histidine kinase
MIDRLQAAVERERRFTADASHELRAPLAVIQAETTLALEHPRTVDEYRRALSVIDEQTEAMEQLVTELLLLARVESTPQQREALPLSSVVDAAVDECRIRMERSEVRVDVDVREELLVRGSPTLLARAIRNIVDNAVKVSAPGDTVQVQARREKDRVVLTVRDNGPGIAPEHQDHIFEPFYQVSPARTPGESHGLGLAICRRIVGAHEGHVDVRSAPGQGACFHIDLPAAEGEARERGGEPVAQAARR